MSSTVGLGRGQPAEGNPSRLVGGIGLLFAGGWVAYVVSLVFSIVVARHLGERGFGGFTIGLTGSILLIRVAPAGMNLAATRYVAIYRDEGDPGRVRGVARLALAVTVAGGTAIGLGMFLLAPVLASGVFHDPTVAAVLRVFALTIPLGATSDTLLSAVRGCSQAAPVVAIRYFAGPSLRLGAVGAAWFLASSPVGVALAYALAEAAVLGLALAAAVAVLPGPAVAPVARPPREMVRFAWPLALNQLVNASSSYAGVFLLGALATLSTVALFAAAERFTLAAEAVMGAAGLAFSPMLSELYAQGRREELERLYQAISRWMLMLGVPLLLTQLGFGGLLLGAFGPRFRAARLALAVLAGGQLIWYTAGTAFHMLVVTGRSRLAFTTSLAYAVVTVWLNVLLIPRHGLLGAAVADAATVLAYGLVTLFEVWRLTGMHPYSLAFLKPAAAGLAAGLLTWSLAAATHLGHGTARQLSLLVVMLLAYVGALVALRLDPDDRMLVGQALDRVPLRGAPATLAEPAADLGELR